MHNIPSKIFKIKDSVDVYLFPLSKSKIQIQFYKINTREKSTIQVESQVSEILSALDGVSTVWDILNKLNFVVDEKEINSFFDYLVEEGYLIEVGKIKEQLIDSKFSRQVNYFDELNTSGTGEDAQLALSHKRIVIFGAGAIGSSLAIQLVRSGVLDLVLIDFKKVTRSCNQRHLYYTRNAEGKFKVDALKEYLLRIEPKCKIKCINEKLFPHSEISTFVEENVDLVINSADEPYIGHTTLKLGRELWKRNIALFVAGGFDAHLMSTGEFIIQGITPCADCCSETFKVALKNWKPTYALNASIDQAETKQEALIVGGAGGLAAQSLFSSSFSANSIINFLIGNEGHEDKYNLRGEYLINKGKMTWTTLNKQEGCSYCGD